MDATTKSRRNTWAWTLFSVGLALAVSVSVIQAFLGWERKTDFGDDLVLPLLIAGFCLSAVAPLFAVGGLRRPQFVALAMLAYLLTFGIVLFVFEVFLGSD
jgi:hypothetical protein